MFHFKSKESGLSIIEVAISIGLVSVSGVLFMRTAHLENRAEAVIAIRSAETANTDAAKTVSKSLAANIRFTDPCLDSSVSDELAKNYDLDVGDEEEEGSAGDEGEYCGSRIVHYLLHLFNRPHEHGGCDDDSGGNGNGSAGGDGNSNGSGNSGGENESGGTVVGSTSDNEPEGGVRLGPISTDILAYIHPGVRSQAADFITTCESRTDNSQSCFFVSSVESEPLVMSFAAVQFTLYDYKTNEVFTGTCDSEALKSATYSSDTYLGIGMRTRTHITSFASIYSPEAFVTSDTYEALTGNSEQRKTLSGQGGGVAGSGGSPLSTCHMCGHGLTIPPSPSEDLAGYNAFAQRSAHTVKHGMPYGSDYKREITREWK